MRIGKHDLKQQKITARAGPRSNTEEKKGGAPEFGTPPLQTKKT
jgi:hypothetical protein